MRFALDPAAKIDLESTYDERLATDRWLSSPLYPEAAISGVAQ